MAQQIASLYADIGAKTDGFKKGAASVKSGLKDIGNDADIEPADLGDAGGARPSGGVEILGGGQRGAGQGYNESCLHDSGQ